MGAPPPLTRWSGTLWRGLEASFWGTPAWWRGERVPGYLFEWRSGSGPASLGL